MEKKKKKTELKDKNLQIRLDPLNISPMTGEIPTNSLSDKSWEHFPEAKKKKIKKSRFRNNTGHYITGEIPSTFQQKMTLIQKFSNWPKYYSKGRTEKKTFFNPLCHKWELWKKKKKGILGTQVLRKIFRNLLMAMFQQNGINQERRKYKCIGK